MYFTKLEQGQKAIINQARKAYGKWGPASVKKEANILKLQYILFWSSPTFSKLFSVAHAVLIDSKYISETGQIGHQSCKVLYVQKKKTTEKTWHTVTCHLEKMWVRNCIPLRERPYQECAHTMHGHCCVHLWLTANQHLPFNHHDEVPLQLMPADRFYYCFIML